MILYLCETKMEIKVVHHPESKMPCTILQIIGSLDTNTSQQLETAARDVYDQGFRYVILDLHETSYISSAGLRAIHSVYNLFRTGDAAETDPTVQKGLRAGTYKSAHLKLVGPSASTRNVLTIAGYDMFLAIYPDLKSALNSF